jgi:adenine/guanine phosphoribosyltransferase-like PRPP-binding protein
MRAPETNEDAAQLALQALIWTLAEPDRAQRLLDTTGLDPQDLRERAGEPAVLAAVLGFLESYEPDLIACADGLGVSPAALVAARAELDA